MRARSGRQRQCGTRVHELIRIWVLRIGFGVFKYYIQWETIGYSRMVRPDTWSTYLLIIESHWTFLRDRDSSWFKETGIHGAYAYEWPTSFSPRPIHPPRSMQWYAPIWATELLIPWMQLGSHGKVVHWWEDCLFNESIPLSNQIQ